MNKLSIEEVIQEAQKAGMFSDLPGKGKPLRLDPSPDAVVNGLLKEANVKPEWVEVAQEIDGWLDSAAQLLSQYEQQHEAEYSALIVKPVVEQNSRPICWWQQWWRRLLLGSRSTQESNSVEGFQRQWNITLTRYAALLHRVNGKIRRYNYLAPGLGRQRALIDVTAQLDEFLEKFPVIQQSPEGVAAARGCVPPQLLEPPVETSPPKLPRDLQAGRIVHHVDRSRRRNRCRK